MTKVPRSLYVAYGIASVLLVSGVVISVGALLLFLAMVLE